MVSNRLLWIILLEAFGWDLCSSFLQHFPTQPCSGRRGVPPNTMAPRQPESFRRATKQNDDGDLWAVDDDGSDTTTYAPKEIYETEAEVALRANAMASSRVELQTEISNSFLQYALSIILGRAIPDVRDGLKPVHRRILYAMDLLQLKPNTPYRKCARVVGEVLGKFHPHGDTAVYDALVRLAQSFSTRYPLIDGHGNFGSVDADPAAAMRYTEARLTSLCKTTLLDDLSEDTVDFVPNFDGNEAEPAVLPAKLPILLLNGASGIAVGMATNIPPHNLNEILTACTALVESRMTGGTPVSDERLYSIVPGPDFPTGAFILGTNGSRQLYETSNGGVLVRATTQVEKIVSNKKSQRTAIVVTELPYQVNKAALLEKIATLVNDKILDGIADLRDESDRDGIRMVIELKRDAVPAVVLNNLYKKTPLQTTFSGNFLALREKDGSLVPHRFTLREALNCFLDFRFATLRRRTAFRLAKVIARREIVAGLLVALENVDKVIQAVRAAEDQESARLKLKTTLGVSDAQVEAILKLQLGQLTRLNRGKLENEQANLQASQSELTTLCEVDDSVYKAMNDEFRELMNQFGSERRTRILPDEDGTLDEVDLIKNSRSVIVVTRGGYIKRMPLQTFESQGRGTRGKRGTSDGGESDDTEISQCFTCNDHDTLLMVTQKGIAYGLYAYQIPIATRTARGQPIPSVLSIGWDDVVTAVLPVSDFSEDEYIVLATEQGWIKKTALSAFQKLSSRGLIIATLEENDRLKWCKPCRDGDDILLGTAQGMATRFEASCLRPTGRTSRGVIAIKLREGDTIADVDILSGLVNITESEEFVLALSSQGFGKRMKTNEFRQQGRGGIGVIALKFKKAQVEDSLSCLRTVNEDDEILVITGKGVMVRQRVSQIPVQSRSATGVTVQKIDQGDHITKVSIVPKYDESEVSLLP